MKYWLCFFTFSLLFSDFKSCIASTNDDLSIRGGQLIIKGDWPSSLLKEIMLDGVIIYKTETFSLAFVKKFEIENSDVVLIENSSGGNACPSFYFFITVSSGKAVKISPEFGTCSDIPKIIRQGNKIKITMPSFNDEKTPIYLYDQGILTENGKLILEAKKDEKSNQGDIEIKGLRIGMTRAEVEEKIGSLSSADLTIAGVKSMYSSINPRFYNDRLDSFDFFFNESGFNDVHEAVKNKYPRLKCEKSEVHNNLGSSFTQVKCKLEDRLSVLTLMRFVSNVNTSVLSLTSFRSLNDYANEHKKRQKDI